MGPLALLTLGFFLGIRHATDADHVIAVATLVHRERTAGAALVLGARWGLGHGMTILIVGGAIVLGGVVVPPRLGLSLEMAVAVMLVLLGVLNLRPRLVRPSPERSSPAAVRWRPLAIGIVHGLAGSAPLALLVLTTIRERVWAFVYLIVFGAGTVVGMMSMTVLLMLPLSLAARKLGTLEHRLTRLTGAISLVVGLLLAYQLGIGDGLLTGAVHWTPR